MKWQLLWEGSNSKSTWFHAQQNFFVLAARHEMKAFLRQKTCPGNQTFCERRVWNGNFPEKALVSGLRGSRTFWIIRITGLRGSRNFWITWITGLRGSRTFWITWITGLPWITHFVDNVDYPKLDHHGLPHFIFTFSVLARLFKNVRLLILPVLSYCEISTEKELKFLLTLGNTNQTLEIFLLQRECSQPRSWSLSAVQSVPGVCPPISFYNTPRNLFVILVFTVVVYLIGIVRKNYEIFICGFVRGAKKNGNHDHPPINYTTARNCYTSMRICFAQHS